MNPATAGATIRVPCQMAEFMATALTITLSGAYKSATFMVEGIGLSGADLTVTAFNTGMPESVSGWGGTIVVFSSLVFGFTTLIGWSYYGQICMEFLFGVKVVRPYRISFVILLFLGALLTGHYAPIITNLGDICNASMAFPNLTMVLAHLAHPWQNDCMSVVRKHPNVWADVSAQFYRPYSFWQGMRLFYEWGVTEKILFASDWPVTRPQDDIDHLRGLPKFAKDHHLPTIPEEEIEGIINRDAVEIMRVD